MLPTCPHCGAHRFTVGRTLTVWQTFDLTALESGGPYMVQDTGVVLPLAAAPFTLALCQDCGADVDVRQLFPAPTSS